MAVKAMYPEKSESDKVEKELNAYGTESFHREQHRVKLGISYLASGAPEPSNEHNNAIKFSPYGRRTTLTLGRIGQR